MKSIKRTQSDYPVLTNEEKFDDFERGVEAVALVQQTEEVLNPEYCPMNQDEWDSWFCKQRYMYGIFRLILQTRKGKEYVDRFARNYNAQQLWFQYRHWVKNSTRRQFSTGQLRKWLTNASVARRDGSVEAFVHSFIKYATIYNRRQPKGQGFTDKQLKDLLEQALVPISRFSTIRDIEMQEVARGYGQMRFEEYVALAESTAQSYDQENRSRNSMGRERAQTSRRGTVNQTYLLPELEAEHEDDLDNHRGGNADEGAEEGESEPSLRVNAAETTTTQRARLPREVWDELPRRDRGQWDMMTPDGKAAIVKHIVSATTKASKGDENKRRAFLTEINQMILGDEPDEDAQGQEGVDASASGNEPEPTSDTPGLDSLIAMAAQRTPQKTSEKQEPPKKRPNESRKDGGPGDIRSVLSTSKGKASTRK